MQLAWPYRHEVEFCFYKNKPKQPVVLGEYLKIYV